MACVAVASLVRTLELEFLQPYPRPILQENEIISCNKEAIQSIHQKLGFLIELLDENRMDGIEAIKDLETRIRDVAFRAEDEIEFQIAHLYEAEEEFGTPKGEKSGPSSFKLDLILQKAIQDIDAIKEELLKIKLQRTNTTALDVDSSQPAYSDNKMVGKDEDFKIIKEMLMFYNSYSSNELQVVTIEGTGGIGKTMLARKVYEDPSIASYFDMRAWTAASQHHNRRQMLLGLLNSMGYYADSGRDVGEEELSQRLRKILKGRRYLVVIDDVWSQEAWDDVRHCLPDDICGSRVLLTTRLAYVANYCDRHLSHQMRFLDQSESWNLFYEKACKIIGAEFETIGRSIVEKCQGLPVAIVVAASLFSILSTLIEWENMAETLNSSAMTTIFEACSVIFSLSYNHLSHKLKACFLHLGVFPMDKVIYVKDLVRLWAVEGLIKEFENESIDAVVERYIHELLDRNLIIVSKRSCCGRKIKAISMHAVLHALCVREAQNENLLHVVTKNGSKLPQKGDFRWLSIQSTDFDTSALYSSSLIKCRSIFCFSEVKTLYLKNFNLLRVFYFTDASMCKKIVDLVHLRYLPPVIRYFRALKLFRAWNFQTQSIYADDGRNYLKFPQQQDSHVPPKLVLKPYHCTIEFCRKNPHLKEVQITGERRECNDCIENLVYLPELEGIYINGNIWDYRTPHVISINDQIAHLRRLKSLSFRSMNFEWKGINVLCKLPRLEILRLFSSGVGEEWELLEEDVFTGLIFLEIFSTDLKHWKASCDSFPKLERLLLRECFQLKEIPLDFADIPTLKSIELKGCLLSAVASAKQIEEEQHDYGKENMIVIEEHTIESDELESSKHESDEHESD